MDTPRGKKQELVLPPFAKSAKGGPCTRWMHIFSSSHDGCSGSRAPSQLARRDVLNLTASAPRLSDLLSNSRSGDAADQQVACVCTPCSAAWSAVAILFVSRLADGDDNVVRWLRASALRPRHTIFGRGADEQRTVTVVMAAAPCHRVALQAGARCVLDPHSTVVYVRIVRCNR